MRLEMASFPVKNIVTSDRNTYQDGILGVNKAEMISLVKEDRRISIADIEIVHPGERTRIVGVRDVVEPRAKAGPGTIFPGVLGPLQRVGDGRTHRLSGMAVVTSAKYASGMRSSAGAPNASILDMWGPGAAITPFSTTQNLVLLLQLVEGLAEFDAYMAIILAELRLAQALAQTTLNLEPSQSESFELRPVPSALPKVVYVLGYISVAHNPHPGVSLYGMPIRESLPTVLHPNELFDGAVTPDVRKGLSNHPRTWDWQNQPVVKGLYKEHGKRLNFLGVIFQRIRYLTWDGKEASAIRTGELAKMLGAQAAIITRMVPSGNMLVDTMLTIRACERIGIKMVFISPEYGGKEGTELPLVFSVAEANSITSSGSLEMSLEVPVPDKVIGPGGDDTLVDMDVVPGRAAATARAAVSLDGAYDISGGIDWWGGRDLKCEEY